MWTRVLVSGAVVAVLSIVLPVRLPAPVEAPSADCLTLPDTPPDLRRTDLVAVLERCAALHPTDVELMADLGAHYEGSRHIAQAESIYRRALAVDPGYAELRLRLGRLLLQRGDAPGARREAAAALKVQPNRQVLLDLLRDASADTGGHR